MKITRLLKYFMSASLALMSSVSTAQVHAQTSINEKAIMAVVDASIKEYRVYATCSSLDEQSLKLVKETWNKSRSEALRDLKSDGASLLFLARFALATEYSKIFDADMKLSEAMPYCYKNKKGVERFYEFGQSNLAQEIYNLQQKSK